MKNNGMKHFCDNVLQDANTGRKEVIDSYLIVLETLRKRLPYEFLSTEERNQIIGNMLEVAEKIDTVNDKHNIFLRDILTEGGRYQCQKE